MGLFCFGRSRLLQEWSHYQSAFQQMRGKGTHDASVSIRVPCGFVAEFSSYNPPSFLSPPGNRLHEASSGGNHLLFVKPQRVAFYKYCCAAILFSRP